MSLNKDDFSTIRLIVSDMDGTLLDDNKNMDPHMIQIISQLEQQGIAFTLASGRNIHIMKSFAEQLHLTFPIIANNGANVYLNGTCLYEKCMDSQDLQTALNIVKEKQLSFLAYTNDTVYVYEVVDDPSLQTFLKRLINKTKIVYIQNVDEIKQASILKVVIPSSNEKKMGLVLQEIHQCVHTLYGMQSENHIYTLSHIEVNKGNAIMYLCDKYKIKKEEILVFGDSFNDISMFNIAYIKVAMKNANKELQAIATHQTNTNNEFGVSQFIKKHFKT